MSTRWVVVFLAISFLGASRASAQMLSAPVLQNAFVNPGLTVGADFGSRSGAQAFGGALAWAPASGVAQVSGGGAFLHENRGASRGTWGLRLMVPVHQFLASRLGVALFGGIGGLLGGTPKEWRAPLGVSVGYRHTLGTSRSVSGYVAPFFEWARSSAQNVSVSHGLARVALGIDFALTPGLGVTAGYETGGRAGIGQPGPTGGIVGLGISYALHHTGR